jgi:type VI secretion system secreted protein VgrG
MITENLHVPNKSCNFVILPLLTVLLSPTALLATTLLGSAQNFAVLGASTVTNASTSTVVGDVGVSPGLSMTGMNTVSLTGAAHDGDAVAQQAEADAGTAFTELSSLEPTVNLTGQDLGSVGVLTPGIYKFSSSAGLTGALTLNFAGNQDQPFIFQIGSTLTTASGSQVNIINGNGHSQVYFEVGSSATLGTGSSFAGNILAADSITLNSGASILCGRAIAVTAAVTMGGNSISDSCGAGGNIGGSRADFGSDGFSGGTVAAIPEAGTWAMMLVGFGGVGVALRRRPIRIALDAIA